MNKNILIAAAASLLFHGSIGIYSLFQTHAPSPVAKPDDGHQIFEFPYVPPEAMDDDDIQGDPGNPKSDFKPAPPSLPSDLRPPTSPFTQIPSPALPGPVTDAPTIPDIRFPGRDESGNPGPIFILAELSHAPQATMQFPPLYPHDLKHSGIEGKVMVTFIVDAQGNVRHAAAEDGRYPEFASAAAAAVSKWHFRPGIKDGIAVATRMAIPVVFSLQSNP